MNRGAHAASILAAADDIEAGDIAAAVTRLEDVGSYFADDTHRHVSLSGAAWREAEALPGMTADERVALVTYLRTRLVGLAQEAES